MARLWGVACLNDEMRKLIFLFIVVALLSSVAIWAAAGTLSSPANTKVGSPPSALEIDVVSAEDIQGWYVQSDEHKACVLLMHGVRSNRREMIGRSDFLRQAGYSSFAIDLQAHGESPGEKITFGYLESNSARAAANYLYQEKSCPKVVSLGSSLGGAASLLGEVPLNVDGYILEAVYPSIEHAVENRLEMRIGSLGRILSPLLYMQIPLRLGVELESLSPLDAIKRIHAPVLVMNGESDKRTTLNEARSLYDNAPSPKAFFEVKGAPHTNLYEYDRETYKKVVLGFLEQYVAG